MAEEASSLRVLTLNLNVHLPSGEASDAVVRAAVADERPDLICFQEALWWGDDETSALHQAEPILAGLGYHHVHQFEVQGTVDSNPAGLTYGTVIASRWPIVRSDTVALPSTARGEGFPRAIQAAEIEVPAPVGRLLLVNPKPHYEPHMELEREMEAVALADYVCVAFCTIPIVAPPSLLRERSHRSHLRALRSQRHADPDGFPPIVASDFDATTDSSSMRFLTGLQSLAGRSVHFVDAWRAAGNTGPGYTHSKQQQLSS